MKELRNLSGMYFRAEREGKWTNVVFEDLEESEQDEILSSKDTEFIKGIAKHLARTLREIADQFDIIA